MKKERRDRESRKEDVGKGKRARYLENSSWLGAFFYFSCYMHTTQHGSSQRG